MDDKKKQLQDVVKSQLDDPVIIVAYLEHQLDIQGRLLDFLIGVLPTSTTIPSDIQNLIQAHQGLMEHSSIDFSNLSDPFQSYKIPLATSKKQRTRQVQLKYLQRQQQEGLLNS